MADDETVSNTSQVTEGARIDPTTGKLASNRTFIVDGARGARNAVTRGSARRSSDLLREFIARHDRAAPGDTVTAVSADMSRLFDREMLEDWLCVLGSKSKEEKASVSDILDTWDLMPEALRTEAERRVRELAPTSIRRGLLAAAAAVDRELRAQSASRLPRLRLLLRNINTALKRYDLRITAASDAYARMTHGQQLIELTQRAVLELRLKELDGVAIARVTRDHIRDELRRERHRQGRPILPRRRLTAPGKRLKNR